MFQESRDGRDGHRRVEEHDLLAPAPHSRGFPRARHAAAADTPHRAPPQARQAGLRPPRQAHRPPAPGPQAPRPPTKDAHRPATPLRPAPCKQTM